MKKKSFLIAISLWVILITVISSCNLSQQAPSGTDSTQSTADDSRIKELEAQIILLMQNQQLSENKRKEEISKLEAAIEKLKATDTEAPTESGTEAQKTLSYTVENGKAIITSIYINEETVTIPAVIDGFQVSSIGSDAIKSQSLKKLIISPGIEKIDWFAFRNCVSLSSISIPDSVLSIGYGAFDNTSRSLTISCNRDSFAHKYAQSYGITYDIT
jgi:hypothetical protein